MEHDVDWEGRHGTVVAYISSCLLVVLKNLKKALAGLVLDDMEALVQVDGQEAAMQYLMMELADLYNGWSLYDIEEMSEEEQYCCLSWQIRAFMATSLVNSYWTASPTAKLDVAKVMTDCVKVWAKQGFAIKGWLDGMDNIVVVAPVMEGDGYNDEDATSD